MTDVQEEWFIIVCCFGNFDLYLVHSCFTRCTIICRPFLLLFQSHFLALFKEKKDWLILFVFCFFFSFAKSFPFFRNNTLFLAPPFLSLCDYDKYFLLHVFYFYHSTLPSSFFLVKKKIPSLSKAVLESFRRNIFIVNFSSAIYWRLEFHSLPFFVFYVNWNLKKIRISYCH